VFFTSHGHNSGSVFCDAPHRLGEGIRTSLSAYVDRDCCQPYYGLGNAVPREASLLDRPALPNYYTYAGVGSKRQQWITYRDAATYAGIVRKGPLFPLNALMLHGLIYARDAQDLDSDPGNDFGAEIHAYFGTGTELQEMYVTPTLLTRENWDSLAEAARWARAPAPVLKDTHWIGGDPVKLEPYGHAAWADGRAVLCLRNAKDAPPQLAVDVAQAFELRDGAARSYTMRSPWTADGDRPAVALEAGTPHAFTLQPFEVLTLNT
jgi:hypothetical protein